MAERRIHITAPDRERLRDCIDALRERLNDRDLRLVDRLERELDRASVIEDPVKTPKDVITMRSKVRLRDMETRKDSVYTLVYPTESDPVDNQVSIVAPIGTAMLGYRVGDVIEWDVPKGKRRLKVEEILYQPEAAGDYDL